MMQNRICAARVGAIRPLITADLAPSSGGHPARCAGSQFNCANCACPDAIAPLERLLFRNRYGLVESDCLARGYDKMYAMNTEIGY